MIRTMSRLLVLALVTQAAPVLPAAAADTISLAKRLVAARFPDSASVAFRSLALRDNTAGGILCGEVDGTKITPDSLNGGSTERTGYARFMAEPADLRVQIAEAPPPEIDVQMAQALCGKAVKDFTAGKGDREEGRALCAHAANLAGKAVTAKRFDVLWSLSCGAASPFEVIG